MPSRPTILLILSFPVGVLGYTVAAQVLTALGLAGSNGGILVLFVPLFVAGLCMMPLLIPFFDRKAKQDLAEYRRTQIPADEGSDNEPGDGPSPEV